MPRKGSFMTLVYYLPYSTHLPPNSPNPTTFSPTPMLITSLFHVPTPSLIRWLRHIHQILRSGQLSDVWPFLSARKSTISLFTPQFAQSSTHLQVTLNSSILPIERTSFILRVTFNPHFKFNAHVKSLVTGYLPRIKVDPGTSSKPLLVPTGVRKVNHTYHLYVTYPISFHVRSSHMVPQHFTIHYSETPNYPKLCPPDSHWLR